MPVHIKIVVRLSGSAFLIGESSELLGCGQVTFKKSCRIRDTSNLIQGSGKHRLKTTIWNEDRVILRIMKGSRAGPVFCLLLGVSSGCARPITGQVTSVTWPVIGWAYSELTPSKRQKTGPSFSQCQASRWRWSGELDAVSLNACSKDVY